MRERSSQMMFYRGLSTIYPEFGEQTLGHASGAILVLLDKFFQELLHSSNIFEFIQLAGRIIYDLSNFPPIIKGSAAVNTWIIDNIAKIKFGFATSIRPQLYDWTAFFETQEQYLVFYNIATIAKYLETIPFIYTRHENFLKMLSKTLREDPNLEKIFQERVTLWEELKDIIEQSISSQQLSHVQKKQLMDIAGGKITFRKPSTEIRLLLKKIAGINADELTKELLDEIIESANYSKQKFYNIMCLQHNIGQSYLNAHGNQAKEDELNAKWVELEIIRCLPIKHLCKLEEIFPLSDKIIESKNESEKKLTGENHPHHSELNILRQLSFASWEDVAKVNCELLELLNPVNEGDTNEMRTSKLSLQEAIWSGGIRIQDLAGFRKKEVALATSQEAIKLYQRNEFTRSRDILTNSICDKLSLSNSAEETSTNVILQRRF